MNKRKPIKKISALLLSLFLATAAPLAVMAEETSTLAENGNSAAIELDPVEVTCDTLSAQEITAYVNLEDQNLDPEELDTYQEEVEQDLPLSHPFLTKRLILLTDQLVESYGAREVKAFQGLDTYLLQYDSEEEATAAYQQIQAELGAQSVYPDSINVKTLDTDYYGPDYPKLDANMDLVYSWGADYMGMTKMKNLAQNDVKVKVAVIDTGLDTTNPFFKGRTLSSDSHDFIKDLDGIKNMMDTDGHGTHVAGTIVDATPANVEIMALRAVGDNTTSSQALAAFDYAIDHGAHIINASIFVGTFGEQGELGYGPMEKVLEKARDNDVIICASAGNSGDEGMVYPASSPLTVSVGSIDESELRSSFSCYDEGLDFVAPGNQILSACIGDSPMPLDFKSGTSMAAPAISAAFAYVKMQNPGASVDDCYEALKAVAKDLGEAGRDKEYGYGVPMVNKLSGHKHSYTYEKGTSGKHTRTCEKCGYTDTRNCQTYKMTTAGKIRCTRCNRTLKTAFDFDTASLILSSADRNFISMPGINHLILNNDNLQNFRINLGFDEGYTKIPDRAFSDNIYIGSVSFPESMESIGRKAFSHDFSLNKIDLSKTNISFIDEDAFAMTYQLSVVKFPKTLTQMGFAAFENSNIKNLDLSNTSITKLARAAFMGNYGLETIALPKDLEEIGYLAFSQCPALKTVNLDNTKVKKIEMHAFAMTDALEEVALPKTLKTIETGIFQDCPSLKKVYFLGDWPDPDINPQYQGQIFENDSLTVYAPEGNQSWNKVFAHPDDYQFKGNVSFQRFTVKELQSMTLSKASFYYDGSAHYPKVTVKDTDGTILSKATASNVLVKLTLKLTNKKPGTYTIKAQGRVADKGSLSKTYTIAVKPQELDKVNAATKAFTAKWTKLASKYVSGYQIQYSTSKSKLSNNEGTKVSVSGASSTSKKVSSLKAGKTYYVKLRTYKTISGKKYYSSWSEIKKVKTK